MDRCRKLLQEYIEKIDDYSQYLKEYVFGQKQIKDKELHRIRIAYGKLFLEAIRTGALLYEKMEIEEIKAEIEELKNEFKKEY